MLPDVQGRCAQAYIDLSQWQPKNNAQYLLPDFTLSFFPPGEPEPLVLTLPGEPCKTYAQGQAHKQVLAYWATLLQCDLEMLGWQVQEQTQGILITATSPRAGWNLKGSFSPAKAEAFTGEAFDLPTDISSWNHVPGEVPLLVWGPYQIGEKTYVCQIPLGNAWTEQDVQNALQQDLRRQGFAGTISWEQGHLCLEFPMGVQVQALERFSTGHEIYPLHLKGVKQAYSISFRLNGQVYEGFNAVDTLADVLTVLNQQAEAQQLRFTLHEERLCVQALDTQTPLKLEEISPHAQDYLGLSPLDLDSPDIEYNKRVEQVVEWLVLARQYVPLLAAESVLQGLLSELSQHGERLFQTHPEQWKAALARFLDVLDEWMVQSESMQVNPLWHLERTESSQVASTASTPQALAEKPTKNRPSSQFDHKI